MTRAISSSAPRNGCGMAATARSTRRSNHWWCAAGRMGNERDPRRRFGMAPVSYGAMDPDPAAAPEGFLVTADDGTKLHFHDWGGPSAGAEAGRDEVGAETRGGETRGEAAHAGVLLVPGLLQAAWSWAPVARRLRRHVRTV